MCKPSRKARAMAREFVPGDEIVEIFESGRWRVVSAIGDWYRCRRITCLEGQAKLYDCPKEYAHEYWVRSGHRKIKQ